MIKDNRLAVAKKLAEVKLCKVHEGRYYLRGDGWYLTILDNGKIDAFSIADDAIDEGLTAIIDSQFILPKLNDAIAMADDLKKFQYNLLNLGEVE